MFASISLTSPILLAGLGLLTLPIVAHLLQRHSRRRLIFPTTQLLLAAVANQSRLNRLKRRMLLLLRLAAAACIVFAFTRPVWLDASSAADNAGGRAAGVVLLIDVSASTAQQSGTLSGLDRLRAAANRTLDSLRSGTDRANIIEADATPQAFFPRMSPNISALRSELQRMQPTEQRADFTAALAAAGKLLGEHQGPRRLVILSDLQATNWTQTLADADLGQLFSNDVIVTVAAMDGAGPGNVSLSGARHFPAHPIGGQKCDLAVRVSNHSESAQQPRVVLDVETEAEPSASQERTVVLAPGEERDVSFEAVLPVEGLLLATFSIPSDALAADNRAALVVRSASRLPVLVVSDDSPDEPGTAAYYLVRALNPRNSEGDRYDVRHARGSQLTPTTLTGMTAVFVGYVGDLPAKASLALASYIESGGGVVWFCGEGPVARNLTALRAGAGDRDLLPWQPGVRRAAGPRDEALHITAGRWQSRWFREFDEQSQIAIARIRFPQTWSVAAPPPETEVLLTFSNGQPALGSRNFGAGRLVVANFSPESTSSDLGKHGAFVAWMQILAQSLAPELAESQAATPGSPLACLDVFTDEDVRAGIRVEGPSGAAVSSTLTSGEGGTRVEILQPLQAGHYRIYSGERLAGAAAVGLDAREGDLRRIEERSLIERIRGAGLAADTRQVAGWSPVLNLSGNPLWGICLTIALCALGLELFLLGLWRR